MSYKKWTTPWRLHSGKSNTMSGWVDELPLSKFKWKWWLFGLVVLIGSFVESRADVYDFPPKDVVTMDVLKANGQSGTFLCPSERWCYIKSLEYEARGGEQYCVSLTMKRNGKVVWYRRYQ